MCYAFPIEGSRRGFGGISPSSFAEMVSQMRSHSYGQQRVPPLSPAQTPCNKRFPAFFSEVDAAMIVKKSSKHDPDPTSSDKERPVSFSTMSERLRKTDRSVSGNSIRVRRSVEIETESGFPSHLITPA